MFFTFAGKESGNACIYVAGELYGIYDLNEDTRIHIESDDGYVNDIGIKDGSVYMESATCPYKECVKCGKISRNGESICCLPAKIMIIISSDEKADYDAITK